MSLKIFTYPRIVVHLSKGVAPFPRNAIFDSFKIWIGICNEKVGLHGYERCIFVVFSLQTVKRGPMLCSIASVMLIFLKMSFQQILEVPS